MFAAGRSWKMHRTLRSALLGILCLLLAACSAAARPGAAEQAQVELTVLAASSLTDAFADMAALFEAENPGVRVLLSFGGSSELATQLAEGAPADLFASANMRQMQNAMDAGRIAEEPVNFLTNSLVVIVPADNPAGIETLADLANPGIRFVSAAPAVPIRDFAEQVLDKASADPQYGTNFKEAVMANLVSEEDNVRQLAAKVALGEADAGIVYISDVTPDIADQVQVIEIAEAVNVVAVYPLAVVSDSAHPDLAQAFIDLVLSDEGQKILEKWGFGPAPDATSSN
ncbi:MAG: molybdate ABC transporter substrate-binding protein [Chloroflexi bacterium]|jgi:molybdate transport system substrate-binding protein|nr:molybdate ABC transporter substrate-binding protein [Chloroflexota bacterium]